jgi:protein-L-isoaspartate(D-aspartate) O-methyltransferase
MMTPAMTAAQRRFFAEEVQSVANLRTPRLIEAFATVPREQFLRPGPWLIRGEGDIGGPPRATPDADPRHVSHNIVVAIDPARQLFNGMPSALGNWIDTLALQPGDRVLHVGCGLGYYSALMAHCVGEGGRVVAIDVDDGLVAEARANLAAYPQVDVCGGSGIDFDLDGAGSGDGGGGSGFDAILINAGMTHPHPVWLDALRPGGRLVLPLTCPFPPLGTTIGKGIVVAIADRGGPALDARLLNLVAVYSAIGIREPAIEEALGKAMMRNPMPAIRHLRRDAHEPLAGCWFHQDTFCLSLE